MTAPDDPIRTVVNVALGVLLFAIVIALGVLIVGGALTLAGFR